jgi:type I restriction enzyme S subunit
MANGPGVVTGRYGTIGQVFYVPTDFWPLNTTLYVCDFKGADPRFVSYFLTTLDFQAYTDKAAVPGINRNDLHRADVLWPPRQDQDRIAYLLGSLDDKIELNRRMAATLEEMARALFKSWFVDFDPVRAKAEGRDPGLSAATAALFPDRFGEDGLPMGWQLTEITRFFDLVGGGTPKTNNPEYWQGDIPWFSIADAPSAAAPFILGTERSISAAGLESCASPLLPVGSTIITARGTVGKLGIVGSPMAFNQSCYAAIPSANFSPYFVYYQLVDAIRELAGRSHGSVFSTVTRQTFEGLLRPFGQAQLASSFDALVAPIMDGISERLKQSQTLMSLRDSLLPKLISGELRIKHSENTVEAA